MELLFVFGSAVFGLLAALAWVLKLLIVHCQMRQHPLIGGRASEPYRYSGLRGFCRI